METTRDFDLTAYMSNSIRNIMAKAYKNVLSNPREAKFAYKMSKLFDKSDKLRQKVFETENIHIPPFLICSISTICNLHCKGCYARNNGIATDNHSDSIKELLSPEQWHNILSEAASLGVNFALLAGGEPLMRKDIIEEIAKIKNMIFPVFTNGTLIGPTYTDFLREHLNIIPIISIEGTASGTDERRGKGVFRRALQSMEHLHKSALFFGTSITVTSENLAFVTSEHFINQVRTFGCKIVFFIEYVPTEPGTEHLTLTNIHVEQMENNLKSLRDNHTDIIFLSFPGDEKAIGGCLASGRGFFHIGPKGNAEPCPFAPFSDTNVAKEGFRKAIQSPLFNQLRTVNSQEWEHTGGCTLFEHRTEIENMVSHTQQLFK